MELPCITRRMALKRLRQMQEQAELNLKNIQYKEIKSSYHVRPTKKNYSRQISGL